jgi:hypothetical protein
MTFDTAFAFSRRLNEKISNSEKFKHGGFAYPYFKTFGIPGQDLTSMTKFEINKKYKVDELILNKKLDYRTKLLNISKLL